MGAIAVSRTNPNVIYAGTGEANNSGDSYAGHGILKSVDGGQTWSVVGKAQFDLKAISKIAVSPADPNTVYAAVSTAVFSTPGGTGVWKSTDGGNTWSNTTISVSAFGQ